MVGKVVKTLIEIDREIWSQTKAFATARGYTLATTLDLLLTEILSAKGYKMPKTVVDAEIEKGAEKCQ